MSSHQVNQPMNSDHEEVKTSDLTTDDDRLFIVFEAGCHIRPGVFKPDEQLVYPSCQPWVAQSQFQGVG